MRRSAVLALLVLLSGAAFVFPAHGAMLFGLVDKGMLYASEDGGATWTVRATTAVPDAIAIAATVSSDTLVMATRSGTLYRSNDAGLSWVATATVPSQDVADMLVRHNGEVLLLTERGTLWSSPDGASAFSNLATLTASNHVGLTADNGGVLYALTRTGEVAKSVDDGTTWDVVGAVTAPDAVDILAIYSDLFVMTGKGDIARSTDGGTSWMYIGTVSHVEMQSLTRDGGGLVAASSKGLVARSTDGTSWSFVGSISQVGLAAIGNDIPNATGIGPEGPPRLGGLRLLSAWPNPNGPAGGPLRFLFSLPQPDRVSIELYDVQGKRAARRPPEFLAVAGDHVLPWHVGEMPSGVYFARLTTAKGLSAGGKIVLIR